MPDPIALYGHQAFGEMAAFADENVIKSFEALVEAGRHAQRMIKGAVEFNHRMKDMGFPPQFGGVAQAPFDALSDYFRGAKGAMLDMYRHPDEVLEAVDLLLPLMIKRGLSAKKRGVPRVFMPLHKGLDGFMSPPAVRTVLLAKPAESDHGLGRGRHHAVLFLGRGLHHQAGNHGGRSARQGGPLVRKKPTSGGPRKCSPVSPACAAECPSAC